MESKHQAFQFLTSPLIRIEWNGAGQNVDKDTKDKKNLATRKAED